MTSPQVRLREFSADDVDPIHDWLRDPDCARFTSWEVQDRDAAVDTVARAMADARQSPRSVWELAVEAAEGEVVGSVRIRVESWRHRRGDIGYVLRRRFWGRGLATAAVDEAVTFAFGHVGLHRMSATVHPDNERSIRVLQRSGFTFEARMHDHMIAGDGYRDSLLFAVIGAA